MTTSESVPEKQTDTSNSNSNSNSNADDETKPPSIKRDIVLSLKAIPEFDQYPFQMQKEKFYFMASIKAPYFRAENRAPLDLVCVIDESGSMSGERITLVRETVQFVIKNLEAQDRFACVGYSSTSRVIIGLTKMDQKGSEKAAQACQGIRATGSTALCDGLCRGIDILRTRPQKANETISSVLLFTDGQATDGPKTATSIILAMSDPNWIRNKGKPAGKPVPQPPGVPINANANANANTSGGLMGYFKNLTLKSKPAQRPQLQQQLQQQAPPQIQQQVQGVPPPQVQAQQAQVPTVASNSNSNSNTNNDADDDETKKKETAEGEVAGNALPCTVNTFGFGEGHNAALLEAISDHGRGMYAFIKNTAMIAETFAECLGGLVSVIGQKLNVKVEALNDVQLNKCLSQGFAIRTTRPNKEMAVVITDIQSEESRDLVFELMLPKLAAKKMQFPIVQFSCTYDNMIKKKKDILSTVCNVDRVEGTETGERNIELDVQYNRLLAAEAMDQADQMAKEGKLNEARNVLKKAQVSIQESRTNKNAYCVNLVNDISKCSQKLASTHSYNQHGSKMLKMNKKAHYMQRSVQSNAYSSQSSYQNKSKSSMMRSFKK